jgi:hypothetical protein
VGPASVLRYLDTLLHINQFRPYLEAEPHQMINVRGLLAAIVPSRALSDVIYAAMLLMAVSSVCATWRVVTDVRVCFAITVLATLAFGPHAYSYDLIVLSSAAMVLWGSTLHRDDIGRARLMSALLYMLCFAPLFGNVALKIGVPITPIVLCGLSITATAMSIRRPRTPSLTAAPAVGG